jgi:nitrogen fixation/metabolism regulation signal transduction histidine kinase
MVAATAAAAVYILPLLIEFRSSAEELFAVILIIILEAAAMGLVVSKTVLQPLKKLEAGSKQAVRGNFKSEFYRGIISKSDLGKADELSRALTTFELMRRKILQLEKNLADSTKSKGADVQEIKDQLIQKETVLQRANANLVGQHEELNKINEDLSSKKA